MEGSAKSTGVETVHSDADHLVATAPKLFISIENSEPTVPHLGRVHALFRDLAQAHQGGVGMLIVIRDQARPPNEAVRLLITRMFVDMEGSLSGLAYVMEGGGFIAAAKRSALAVIMIAKRYKFPIKVFSTVTEAIPWLAMTVGFDGGGLVPEVERLREAQYEKRPARR